MKNLKIIAYIILILAIIALSFIIYTTLNKVNDTTQKEKTFSEIEYVETKFVDLFNTVNNIRSNNYNIKISELAQESKQKSSESNSSSTSQGGGEQSSGGSGQSQGGQGGQSSQSGQESQNGQGGNTTGSSQEAGGQEDYSQFEMEAQGVLTDEGNVNWDYIKNEVEIMYESIPTITLDLYQSNTNKDDILSFNNEYDKLIIAVKNEDKQETLNQLSKGYDYISNFVQNTTDDTIEKNIIQTKSNVLKAYTKLDSKDWTSMSTDISNAVNIYSNLLTDTNIDTSKQYNINKVYISLNELQNAVTTQDERVFLIKYKNLLEEINNI